MAVSLIGVYVLCTLWCRLYACLLKASATPSENLVRLQVVNGQGFDLWTQVLLGKYFWFF